MTQNGTAALPLVLVTTTVVMALASRSFFKRAVEKEAARRLETTSWNLNQVTVPCLGLERSINFYQGVMGLRLIVRDDEAGYARFECFDSDTASTFSLHETTASLVSGAKPIVYFEAPSEEALWERVRKLKSQGIEVSEPVAQSWKWTESSLRDPNGNEIILYHAGANRRFPPWRL